MNESLREVLDRQLRKLMPEKFPSKPKKPAAPVPPDHERGGLPKVHLVFQQGSSDKEYLVEIVKVSMLYEVRFEYGRRNGHHEKGTKTDNPCSFVQAKSIYNKLVAEKKKKGYKEI